MSSADRDVSTYHTTQTYLPRCADEASQESDVSVSKRGRSCGDSLVVVVVTLPGVRWARSLSSGIPHTPRNIKTTELSSVRRSSRWNNMRARQAGKPAVECWLNQACQRIAIVGGTKRTSGLLGMTSHDVIAGTMGGNSQGALLFPTIVTRDVMNNAGTWSTAQKAEQPHFSFRPFPPCQCRSPTRSPTSRTTASCPVASPKRLLKRPFQRNKSPRPPKSAHFASFPSGPRPHSERTILTMRRLPSKTPAACNSVKSRRFDRLQTKQERPRHP